MPRTTRLVWSTASTYKELLTCDQDQTLARVRAYDLTAAELVEMEQACAECRALLLSSAPDPTAAHHASAS